MREARLDLPLEAPVRLPPCQPPCRFAPMPPMVAPYLCNHIPCLEAEKCTKSIPICPMLNVSQRRFGTPAQRPKTISSMPNPPALFLPVLFAGLKSCRPKCRGPYIRSTEFRGPKGAVVVIVVVAVSSSSFSSKSSHDSVMAMLIHAPRTVTRAVNHHTSPE